MRTATLSPQRYRLLLVAALGLVGCAIAIVATTPPAPATTRDLLALGFGLVLAFVGLSGVIDAVRN